MASSCGASIVAVGNDTDPPLESEGDAKVEVLDEHDLNLRKRVLLMLLNRKRQVCEVIISVQFFSRHDGTLDSNILTTSIVCHSPNFGESSPGNK